MTNFDFRLLDLGKKEDNLAIFKKIGFNAKLTDLGIILGGQVDNNNNCSYFTMNDSKIYERMQEEAMRDSRIKLYPSYYNDLDEDKAYRQASPDERENYDYIEIASSSIMVIEPEKNQSVFATSQTDLDDFTKGIRLVKDIKESDDSVWNTYNENQQGLLELYYGEYPQYVPDVATIQKLEDLYSNNHLALTEKQYTFLTNNDIDSSYDYQWTKHQEYITENGKKYVRVNYQNPETYVLLNGETYEANSNKAVWLEVKPVKFYVDNDKKIAVSSEALTSGCPFLINQKTYDGDFDKTLLSDMVYQMAIDLVPSKTFKLNNTDNIWVSSELVDEMKESYCDNHEQVKSR